MSRLQSDEDLETTRRRPSARSVVGWSAVAVVGAVCGAVALAVGLALGGPRFLGFDGEVLLVGAGFGAAR